MNPRKSHLTLAVFSPARGSTVEIVAEKISERINYWRTDSGLQNLDAIGSEINIGALGHFDLKTLYVSLIDTNNVIKVLRNIILGTLKHNLADFDEKFLPHITLARYGDSSEAVIKHIVSTTLDHNLPKVVSLFPTGLEIRTIKSADGPPACLKTVGLDYPVQPPEELVCPRSVTNTGEFTLLHEILYHETMCGNALCTQPSCKLLELQTRALIKPSPGKLRACKCCCVHHCEQFDHPTDSEISPYMGTAKDL